jgi:uncharacterized phage-associated protein
MRDPLTHFRLHALAYYAQAWSLVLRDSELFPDDILAFEQGPIIPDIYQAMHGAAPWQCVSNKVLENEPDLDAEDEAQFVCHLWSAYNHLSAIGLWNTIQSDVAFLKAKKDKEAGGQGLISMSDLGESLARRSDLPDPLGQYQRQRMQQEQEAERAILSSSPLDRPAIWKECPSRTPSAQKQ